MRRWWMIGVVFGLFVAGCSANAGNDVATGATSSEAFVASSTTSTPSPTTVVTESSATAPVAEFVDEILGTTPDGRFTYLVRYSGRGNVAFNGVLLVDDDIQIRPALLDARDSFDRVGGLTFGEDRFIWWISGDENYGNLQFVGRIDETGRIVDSHQTAGEAGDVEGVRTDPFFVMSADPLPAIDTDVALTSELEQQGMWARENPGSWYRGDTLGAVPACGASTLYKDDADGFARVLDAAIELDTVVDVAVTDTVDDGGADTVGGTRFVVIATECPQEYEGRRLFWGFETVDYGDGGPRFERPLQVEFALDGEVREVLAVRLVNDEAIECCSTLVGAEIDVELLDGSTSTFSFRR